MIEIAPFNATINRPTIFLIQKITLESVECKLSKEVLKKKQT